MNGQVSGLIAKAADLYDAEAHEFRTKSDQKYARDCLSRAYENLRNTDRNMVLANLGNDASDDERWNAFERHELPMNLCHYRPAKHAGKWFDAEHCEVAGQLTSLYYQYKAAGIAPKAPKAAPKRAAGPNAATHMGTCQCCGAQQKLPKGVLSQHGYTVEHGFFQGVCRGAGSLPFEQSCDLAKRVMSDVQRQADELADEIEGLKQHPEYSEYSYTGVSKRVQRLSYQLKGMQDYVAWQSARIAFWAPRELTALEAA